MKPLVLLLIGVGAFANILRADQIDTILDDATRKRMEAIGAADRDYRAATAKTFQFADRVEIYLLDFSIGRDAAYKPKDGEKAFPIRPYNKETKILKERKIPAKDVRKWCDAITKIVTSDVGSGVLCHFPIHGIRIYAGNSLLFETSLCWRCNNYYFCYGPNGTDSGWMGLYENAKELHVLLDEFMPVPDEEKKRFRLATEKPK